MTQIIPISDTFGIKTRTKQKTKMTKLHWTNKLIQKFKRYDETFQIFQISKESNMKERKR